MSINRRFFLKGLAAAITCGVNGRSLAQAFPVVGTALPLQFSLQTAGRVGFYVDYSELSGTGEHVFLVARTHGTAGTVSVQFSSHGDTHDNVSGQLSWADGEADIKSIRVNVPNKTAGDHRMYMQLSNPVATSLHFSAHTRAFGVIDDGTVAPDSEAVFFDTSRGFNGSGSQNSPYNNVYDAIANAGSKRYIYGRGTIIPDGTNAGDPYGKSVKCIFAPSSRSSEETRCILRNWPGSTLTVNGNGDRNTTGFFTRTSESYHTYRGIDFVNLEATQLNGTPGSAIWYHYGTSQGINVELCNFNGINGGENNGGVNLYGVTGAKVWRCNFANISTNGDNRNNNCAGVFSYDGVNISVQRCEFAPTMAHGTFQKRTPIGVVGLNSKFNIYRDCDCHYFQVGSKAGYFGLLVTNNIFIGAHAIIHHVAISPSSSVGENQISNNYFYQSGYSTRGAIANWGLAQARVFSNIFDQCQYVYTDEKNDSQDDFMFFDYNTVFATAAQDVLIAFVNRYQSTADFNSAFPIYASNDSYGNPRPTDPSTEDFSLQPNSAAIATGLGGSDSGVYLTGLEKIGSNTINIINPNPFPEPAPPGSPGPDPVMCTPLPVSGQKIILS